MKSKIHVTLKSLDCYGHINLRTITKDVELDIDPSEMFHEMVLSGDYDACPPPMDNYKYEDFLRKNFDLGWELKKIPFQVETDEIPGGYKFIFVDKGQTLNKWVHV